MNPWQKGTTKKYFFNKVRTVPDKSPIPGKIKLVGNRGEFIFNKSDLRFNVEKETISVDQWLLDKNFNLGEGANEPQNMGITPNNIRKALSLAFPNNWMSEDDIYSAGLRGVYTIGDKINDQTEDWSIMNWMINLFKNDDEFTQLLVDRQWQSIENGLKLERDSVKYLLTKLKSASITFYPHGSKMDRWYGIDVTINGINCQVKPLTSYSEKDGVYTVYTYGMRDYSSKKMVNKIIFANNKEILIFDNKNYSVNSRSKATFNEQPKIVK